MRTLEKMAGHTRLYRRGATYYHRAAVPKDIVETYGKREETFSLRTKDRAEALVRVRIEAVRVDTLFADHRRSLERVRTTASQPPLDELDPEQIALVKRAYPRSPKPNARRCGRTRRRSWRPERRNKRRMPKSSSPRWMAQRRPNARPSMRS